MNMEQKKVESDNEFVELHLQQVKKRIAECAEERKQYTEEECDQCDGCGWYEGGPTIKTTCEHCGGTGKVLKPKKVEPEKTDVPKENVPTEVKGWDLKYPKEWVKSHFPVSFWMSITEIEKGIDFLKYTKDLEKELADLRAIKSPLANLLAVMHGDGGHHEQKVGTIQAVKDAEELLHTKWINKDTHESELNELRAERDKARSERDRHKRLVHDYEILCDKLKAERDNLKEALFKFDIANKTIFAENERLKEVNNSLRNKVIDEVKKRTDPLRGFLTHTELDEILESLKAQILP